MDNTSTVSLHTGRNMPVIGLGSWQLTDDTEGTVRRALELGYPMIDTAADYGTQPGIGAAFAGGGTAADRIYLVSKVETHEDAYDATRRNLRELNLDTIDLTLIHWPPSTGAGVDLWQGLIRARDDGMTRDIGVSNYSTQQIDELAEATGELPAVNQIEWTPFGRSADMLDYCHSAGVVIQAYSPLTRSRRLDDGLITDLAAKYGRSPAQIVLRWNMQLGVVPIPKANRYAHLAENLDVFEFEISETDMAELGRLNQRWSALGQHLQYA